MRTIRLSDPFPRGKPTQKLEWGTSAWAADSCLVEWSRFEREWLEAPPVERPRDAGWSWRASDLLLRGLQVWLGLLLLGLALAWATFS